MFKVLGGQGGLRHELSARDGWLILSVAEKRDTMALTEFCPRVTLPILIQRPGRATWPHVTSGETRPAGLAV